MKPERFDTTIGEREFESARRLVVRQRTEPGVRPPGVLDDVRAELFEHETRHTQHARRETRDTRLDGRHHPLREQAGGTKIADPKELVCIRTDRGHSEARALAEQSQHASGDHGFATGFDSCRPTGGDPLREPGRKRDERGRPFTRTLCEVK